MKKFAIIAVVFSIVAVFVGTAVFLYKKSQEPPVIYDIAGTYKTDIVKKIVAIGNVTPRREINIKSQVSGVVDEIYVEGGQSVKKGDEIARIELIPDMEHLNQAESQLETARINFRNAKRDLERQTRLRERGLISEEQFHNATLEFELQREAVNSAEDNVALITEGATRQSSKVSNIVKATTSGMVLDVPVKEGTFVIETNTFNEGTTIAIIADMSDMIFEGTVDESEVGKLREGMELVLNIGAFDERSLKADLEYIAPKGTEDQGTIKFEIRASVNLVDDYFLRAGYSANADIVLARRDDVLAINEGNVLFENGATYVEVETAEQVFEKRRIETGISDGINIEVVSGLDMDDRIKQR